MIPNYKRYMLFAGDCYYPSGGMDDFVDSYDTLGEAKAEGDRQVTCLSGRMGTRYDWWHILDTADGRKIEDYDHGDDGDEEQ